MNIVLIGTGNVAFVLGNRIHTAGHTIVQVVGRNREKATGLARMLHAEATDDFKKIHQQAAIYIIAITDDALWTIRDSLSIQSGIVLHTAGSVPKDVLQGLGSHYGILYPLQSLRRDRTEIPDIPFLIDADNDITLEIVKSFASALSPLVEQADDSKRMKLHIGAVLVNNFTNHLFTLAQSFCRREQLDFQLLLPIIRETAARLDQYPAATMQTGPAIRNDRETLQKQDHYLDKYPEIKRIYEVFTESIREFHPAR
ncbi:MAG: DUF2520 domain-containing protein [Chitinophagaceae bacterium]|nr:DUF2520 domain-containing protein [Chitinophagaceae bacterium]